MGEGGGEVGVVSGVGTEGWEDESSEVMEKRAEYCWFEA